MSRLAWPARGLQLRQAFRTIPAGASVSTARPRFTSYDHINVGSYRFSLNQQWGIWFIVVSLAVVVIDAQLATRSRLRAAEARQRQAEATERQGQGLALLRGAALLSARLQLDPSELNRSRLNAFLALLAQKGWLDEL
jgi:hypothetical protein